MYKSHTKDGYNNCIIMKSDERYTLKWNSLLIVYILHKSSHTEKRLERNKVKAKHFKTKITHISLFFFIFGHLMEQKEQEF